MAKKGIYKLKYFQLKKIRNILINAKENLNEIANIFE